LSAAPPLARELAARLERPVEVVFGRSRSVPVEVQSGTRGALRVRLHHMFAQAPAEVRADLGSWMRAGKRARRACARLDDWIAAQLAEEPAPPPRATVLRAGGHVHDLALLARPLLAGFFAGDFDERPPPHITWGRRGKSRTRRSLRLGSFEPERNLVRVHAVLDQRAVPVWFVRSVLVHELLHAALPPRPGADGRWVHHSRAFREREQTWPDHARSLRWQERHLAALIRSARADTPLPAPDGAAQGQGELYL
jgi:hypothetical protein